MTNKFKIGDKVKVVGLGPVVYEDIPLYNFHGPSSKIDNVGKDSSGRDRLIHNRHKFYGMVVNTKQIDGVTFYGLDTQATADVDDTERNNSIFLGSYFPADALEFADENADKQEFSAAFDRFCGGAGMMGEQTA